MEKQCLYCVSTFNARHKNTKYCSVRCKTGYYRTQQKIVDKVCIGCGATYQTTPTLAAAQKYCSQSCALRHTVVRKTLTCIDCGQTFEYIGRSTKKRCDACWHKNKSAQTMRRRQALDPTVRVGVGSGAGQAASGGTPEEIREARNVLRRARERRYRENRGAVGNYRSKVLSNDSHCEICGYSNKPALVAHHIDMNRTNNELSNLAVVCANCHAIIHHEVRALMKDNPEVKPADVYMKYLNANIRTSDFPEGSQPRASLSTAGKQA